LGVRHGPRCCRSRGAAAAGRRCPAPPHAVEKIQVPACGCRAPPQAAARSSRCPFNAGKRATRGPPPVGVGHLLEGGDVAAAADQAHASEPIVHARAGDDGAAALEVLVAPGEAGTRGTRGRVEDGGQGTGLGWNPPTPEARYLGPQPWVRGAGSCNWQGAASGKDGVGAAARHRRRQGASIAGPPAGPWPLPALSPWVEGRRLPANRRRHAPGVRPHRPT
jgi:hypothetical protein